MTKMDIIKAYSKLKKRSRWIRWLNLLIAFALLVLTLSDISSGWLSVFNIEIQSLYAVLCGACIALTISTWFGSKELNVAKEAIDLLSSDKNIH